MALVRSKEHKPEGRKHRYEHWVKPAGGYPNPAVLCGIGTPEPGVVWLNELEWQLYQDGVCIFNVFTNAVRIGVQ